MSGTWTITHVVHRESLQTGRLGQMDTVVQYTLSVTTPSGPVAQPYTVRIPKADPSQADVQAAVSADARLKTQLLGVTGQV